MLVMAEQVKMSVPEAIDLLSQKIVDLENTVAAQFMVISVLKFHLENSGVISRSQLANTAELFMNPGEPLFKSPEAEAFFVEYLRRSQIQTIATGPSSLSSKGIRTTNQGIEITPRGSPAFATAGHRLRRA
jgi:hypothetical protein